MSLQVEFIGMKLRTPFLVGSGPWLSKGSKLKEIVKGLAPYWGGIVTKSYLSGKQPYIRPNLYTSKEFRGVALQNIGPPCTTVDAQEMKGLRESCRVAHDEGIVVIGSIIGQTDADWTGIARMLEDAGVDAIELNLSCPADIDVLHGMGLNVGQIPEETKRITNLVKDATALPVIPKLNAIVSNIAEIALACQQGGANGISAINTIPGIIGIDVESGKPYSSDHEGRAYASGISGPLIRPVGLRCVSDIYKKADIPIFGIGGIDDWKSAVEYIMVGASAVQVCTAFMWKGFKLGKRMCKGLSEFMERKGYSSVNDFCGISHKFITTAFEEINVRAVVDEEKCNGCGLCIPACCETQHIAISLKDKDKKVSVDEERCQGCGLCATVCKQEAIAFTSY